MTPLTRSMTTPPRRFRASAFTAMTAIAGLSLLAPRTAPPETPAVTRATPIELPEQTLDLAPDGATIARRDGDQQVCLATLAAPDVQDRCVTLTAHRAKFSPDGSLAVLYLAPVGPLQQRAAVIDVATAALTELDNPAGAAADDPILEFLWLGDGSLLGLSSRGLWQVDTQSGTLRAFGPPLDAEQVPMFVAEAESHVAVQLRGPTQDALVTVAAATDRLSGMDLPVRNARLLAASPDASRVVFTTTDLRRQMPGPATVVDVATGSAAQLELPDETLVLAAGFSPSGDALLVVGLRMNGTLQQTLYVSWLVDGTPTTPQAIGPVEGAAAGSLRWMGDLAVWSSTAAYPPLAWRLDG